MLILFKSLLNLLGKLVLVTITLNQLNRLL